MSNERPADSHGQPNTVTTNTAVYQGNGQDAEPGVCWRRPTSIMTELWNQRYNQSEMRLRTEPRNRNIIWDT